MKFKDLLTEIYINSVKSSYKIKNEVYHIYKNPNGNDWKALKKEMKKKINIRVLSDIETNNIYVADANLLHYDIAKAVNIYKKYEKRPPVLIHSEAYFDKNGKPIYLNYSRDEYSFKTTKDFEDYKKLMNKYFIVKD